MTTPQGLHTGTRPGSDEVTQEIKIEPNDLEELVDLSDFVYDDHFLDPADQLDNGEESEGSGSNQGRQTRQREEEDSENATSPSSSNQQSSNERIPEEEDECEHLPLRSANLEMELSQANLITKVINQQLAHFENLKKENTTLKVENQMLQDKVKKLEKDRYDLDVIANYEIGKLRKELHTEKQKRLCAENNLKAVVIHQSRSLSSGDDGVRDQQEVVVDGRQVGNDDDNVRILAVVKKSTPTSRGVELLPSVVANNKELPPVPEGNQNQHQNLHQPRQRPGPKTKTRPMINTTCQPKIQPIIQNGTIRNEVPSAQRHGQSASNQRRASARIRRMSLARTRKLRLLKGTSLSSRSHQTNVSSGVSRKSRPDFKFRCNVCCESFLKVSLLKSHKLAVHNINDLKLGNVGCVDCGLTFDSRKDHMNHRVIVHGTRVGKKKKAGRNTNTTTSTRAGEQIFNAEAPANVGIRVTTTTRRSTRVLPNRARKVPNRLASSFANVYVVGANAGGSSNKHRLIGVDSRKEIALYRCLCGKVFNKRKTFLTHQRYKNTGKVFNCTLCEKKFDNHSSLKQHVRHFHQMEYEDSGYGCGLCGLRGLETLQDVRHHRIEAHGVTR